LVFEKKKGKPQPIVIKGKQWSSCSELEIN
jgi:hypothetical protein